MAHAEGPWDIDNETSGRSASVIQIETFGKGGVAVLMATTIIAVVLAALAFGHATRAMDRAALAERETRITRDEIDRLQVEIGISTNH